MKEAEAWCFRNGTSFSKRPDKSIGTTNLKEQFMKRILFSASVAALMLNVTSCQNEEIIEKQEGQMVTLQATFGAGTRTSLEENGTGYATKWSAGDQIYVADDYGFVSGVLTLVEGEGQNSGTFSGVVTGNPAALSYAVFPVPTNGKIGLNTADASQTDAPMSASINGLKANFKNECGLVKLKIFNLPENADVRLSAKGIAGDLQVNAQNGVTFSQTAAADEIVIENVKSGQEFFVPVWAGDQTVATEFTLTIGKIKTTFTANIQKGSVSVNGVPEFYVSDGEVFEKKTPVVESADALKDALAAANPGTEITLSDKTDDYGTITLGKLKDVTIDGCGKANVSFKTDKNSKIENVTIKNIAFEFKTGSKQEGACVVIDQDAQIDNLVIENVDFVGDEQKNSYGITGENPNASIVVKNCSFSKLGYAIQTITTGGYQSLTIEHCTFENINSWVIMPQYGYNGDLTITDCTFNNAHDGLVKTGNFNGTTFTFTNNTITNSAGHDGKDSKWFEVNASEAVKVINGNTKDGAAWTPGATEGLK